MCKVSIGNIRYIYSLSKDAARQMAFELEAEIDTTNFYKEYIGNICTKEGIDNYIETIENMYSNNKNTSISIDPLIVYFYKSDELYKAILDALLNSNSISDYYIVNNCHNFYQFLNKFNIYAQQSYNTNDLFRHNELLNIIKMSIIDNSKVILHNAISYCVKNHYSNPSRQHFENHAHLTFSWDEFKNSFPKRGSLRQYKNIEATKNACEKILKELSNSDSTKIKRKDFLKKVEDFMAKNNNSSLYQKSAASQFFWNDGRLKEFKAGRGRPKGS